MFSNIVQYGLKVLVKKTETMAIRDRNQVRTKVVEN